MRNLDEIRAISQTMYLEAQAGLLKRRHRGKTVRTSHIERLEEILKEAEAACSIAASDLAPSTEPEETQSMVSIQTVCVLS